MISSKCNAAHVRHHLKYYSDKTLNYNIIVQYHRFKCNEKSLKYKNKSLLYILF